MSDERRIQERMSTRIELQMRLLFAHELSKDGDVLAAVMLDFNEGGARVSTAANGQGRVLHERLLHESAIVVCEIAVEGAPMPLRICGEVRWARLNGQKRDLDLGLRFMGSNANDADVLNKLTAGQRVVEHKKSKPVWIALAAALALASGWLWLDREGKASELTRFEQELQDTVQRREALAKRLKESEERERALQAKVVAQASEAEEDPP